MVLATTWVLTDDHHALSVYRVPTRRNPRPAWVLTQCAQLGHRIAALRSQAGLSQDQLAERAGIDRRSIQRYEAGTREPQYGDLLLIADVLAIPLADLVR
jgi:DNA-binding XRE family transcriptional regulator